MFLIVKDSLGYLLSLYGSKALSFVCKIVVAKMLGPSRYGLWSAFSLILLYGNFLHFGLYHALVKEVSFHRGKGALKDIDDIKRTVFSSAVLSSCIAAFAILIFSILSIGKDNRERSIVLSLIAFLLIFQQIKNYFFYFFAAEKKFAEVNRLIILATLMIGGSTVLAVRRFNFIGLPLGLLIGNLVYLSYVFIKYNPSIRSGILITKLCSLIKIGSPIMFLTMAYASFFAVDRFLIFTFLGKESLGYYSIVLGLSELLIAIPASLGVIIFPRLSEKYGSTGEIKDLISFIRPPAIAISYIMTLFASLTYLLLPYAVKIIIPRYAPGVYAGQMALAGILFLSISVLAQNFLVSINRQFLCLSIALAALLLKIILIGLLFSKRLSIESVAMAGNITYFFYSALLLLSAVRHYKESILASLKHLINIYFPLIYLTFIFVLYNYLGNVFIFNIEMTIPLLSINFIFLFVFLFVPFGYIFKTRILPSFFRPEKEV